MRIDLYLCHRTVSHMYHPVCHRRNRGIMGYNHNGHILFPAGILQKLQNLFAGVVIQCAGRFIA